MKIAMIEACDPQSRGSIGAWYIMEHARRAGFQVDYLTKPKPGYDIELISVHHVADFPLAAMMPKLAKWRIMGGHPMQNNPLPMIPFADALCIGEGESWIKKALPLLQQYDNIDAVADLPGTIISHRWHVGDAIPDANYEQPLPDNPPYLNYKNTRSAAWYVEIARGCPYKCEFCELGNSSPFRLYPAEHIKHVLDMADTNITRKINFYAPDEISHPAYHELLAYLMERGYSASFSSMRIDSILKRGLPAIKKNHLIRVGIDGLTEETRFMVGKRITDEMIETYFRAFIERGHVRFKCFYIFGYPWETVADFDGFESLFERLKAIPLHKNIHLRIKWTPFIPQPCTPLGKAKPNYDFAMVDKIRVWHALNDLPRDRDRPGWYIEADAGGPMGFRSHQRQCELTVGDETILLHDKRYRPLYQF